MSSFQFIYSGSDTRKITRSDRDPVIISGDSNSTTFKFEFPESHKGYKKTIEWDFWIKDPEGNLMNPSYPLINDEHIIPGEVTYLNSGKLVGFSLIFERDDDPLFQERSTIYPIYISKGVKITKNVSIFDTLMQEVYITSSKVEEHTSDVDNPHSVTKAQVGLGNSDNTSDIDKPISSATQTALDEKQDKLTFDDVPIADSDNPVTGGGIYNALQAIEMGNLTLDDAPVAGSDNPVKSGGIYDALQAIELMPGPSGEKGEKGDTGAQGPQGPQGDKGDTGPKGDIGPEGPKGDKGDKGDMGDKGDIGPEGPQGPMGDIGPEGPQGPKGEKGDTGPQGPKGEKGDTGEQGLPGEYEFATEEEAIGGTNNTTIMSPLRVDQAFNEKFKVIDGVLNVFENGEWVQYVPK